jgi:hypothetical protein
MKYTATTARNWASVREYRIFTKGLFMVSCHTIAIAAAAIV